MTEPHTCPEGRQDLGVRDLLKRLGLRPQKQFGQNFLVSGGVLHDIVAAAHLSNDDFVVEVGPGLGILTEALATRAGKVIAVEVDRGLATTLKEKLKSSGNVIVLERDILEVSSEELMRSFGTIAPPAYKVVANLPYYISSAVINHFLGSAQKPGLMLVTVQKEVGKVISAKPGEMSFLSVLVQFYAKPTIVRAVPAGCFYPTPKVDSVVLQLKLWPEPPEKVSDVEDFFRFVKCGFRAPRKQLRNPLSACLGMNPSRVSAMLMDAGVDPVRRAETVSLHEWAIMYARFAADADYQGARQAEYGSGSARKTPGRLP